MKDQMSYSLKNITVERVMEAVYREIDYISVIGNNSTLSQTGDWNDSGLEESLGDEQRNITTGGYSTEEESEDGSLLRLVISVIGPILMVASLLGNLPVLSIMINRIFRVKKASSVHWLVCSLAIADILVTSVYLPVRIGLISKTTWKAGDFLCRILGFLDVFGLYLSALSVICISVDRYIVICHPFRIMEAVRRAKWMLWFAGIASFILSLPEFLLHHVEIHPVAPQVTHCTSFGFFTSEAQDLAYTTTKVVLFCGIPFLVIVACYVRILWSMFFMDDIRRSGGVDTIRLAKRRAVKLFIIISLAYLICWTPTHVITLWFLIDSNSAYSVDLEVYRALSLFSCLSPCLNSVLYGVFHLKR